MLRQAFVVLLISLCTASRTPLLTKGAGDKLASAEAALSKAFAKKADEVKEEVKLSEHEAIVEKKEEAIVLKKEEAQVKKTEEKLKVAKKFPYWSTALPNFTAVKSAFKAAKAANASKVSKEKTAKESKDKKFPYWSAAMPNLTAVKSSELDNKTKATDKESKDKKFPYWSGAMPNLTAVKSEKLDNQTKEIKAVKSEKIGNQTKEIKAVKSEKIDNQTKAAVNQTKPQKPLLASGKLEVPKFFGLGPFASKEAACDYCFTSHTRSSVVQNCICTAYDGDSGPNMFCTGSKGGVNYASNKKGACRCVQNNAAKMGQTTCDPF